MESEKISKRVCCPYRAHGACGGLVHIQPPVAGRNNHGRYHCSVDGCITIGQVEADEVIARLVVKRVCRPDIRELFSSPTTMNRPDAPATRRRRCGRDLVQVRPR